MSTSQPTLLGSRFEPERVIREGFVTTTWLARDLETGELAVVKVLHADMRREPVIRAWFAEQPAALARLDHPNVVELLHDGCDDEPPFFATEFLPGGSLEELVASGRRPSVASAVRLGVDVLSALEHAHERGILHGALKPGNVLFDAQGRACVTDFGPSRERLRHVTMVGVTAGASMFLAPEQGAIPVPTDARTDLYALGAVLLHALTGARPVVLLGPERDAELRRLPVGLREVVDRATRPDVAARYASAAAMREALEPLLARPRGIVAPVA